MDRLIKTVKNQIDYFHRVINKNPKKSTIQANFWALICEFEAVLQYLVKQKEKPFSENKKPLANFDFEEKKPLKWKHKPRQKTLHLEDTIFKIIDAYVGETPVSHIRDALALHGYPDISESRLTNRLYNMHRNRNVVKTVRKGFYCIIKDDADPVGRYMTWGETSKTTVNRVSNIIKGRFM